MRHSAQAPQVLLPPHVASTPHAHALLWGQEVRGAARLPLGKQWGVSGCLQGEVVLGTQGRRGGRDYVHSAHQAGRTAQTLCASCHPALIGCEVSIQGMAVHRG